jgi:hypothetical protein
MTGGTTRVPVTDRTRDTAVELPANLDPGNVGFHPDHRGDEWAVRDGTLHFRTVLQPEETVSTICAVDAADTDQIDDLIDGGSRSETRADPTSGADPARAAVTW